MKRHVRAVRPLTLNDAKLRMIEPEALTYARGGGGQTYPGTEYDAVPTSPDRS